jgi:hypothetical protein
MVELRYGVAVGQGVEFGWLFSSFVLGVIDSNEIY